MSDDLVKRLQSLHRQATVERSHFYVGSCAEDAMHRIEELKAKLAKALELAEEALDFNDDGNDYAGWRSIQERIEELKG